MSPHSPMYFRIATLVILGIDVRVGPRAAHGELRRIREESERQSASDSAYMKPSTIQLTPLLTESPATKSGSIRKKAPAAGGRYLSTSRLCQQSNS